MLITQDTRVSEILRKYGDIASVMEIFGVKRVGQYSLRSFFARFLTVKTAAIIHRVPLEKFITILEEAIQHKQA